MRDELALLGIVICACVIFGRLIGMSLARKYPPGIDGYNELMDMDGVDDRRDDSGKDEVDID